MVTYSCALNDTPVCDLNGDQVPALTWALCLEAAKDCIYSVHFQINKLNCTSLYKILFRQMCASLKKCVKSKGKFY